MIKNYLKFLKENIKNDESILLSVSEETFLRLKDLTDNYSVAHLLYQLKNRIPRDILADDYADFIKLEENGYVSYLKSKYWKTENDVWNSVRRVSQKVTKSLKEIYNEDYLKSLLVPKDYDDFIIKMTSLSTNSYVEEFRGEDLLRAYNYKKELNLNFGHSCANFYQKELRGNYKDPLLEEYNVWVKNPENCGVVVVWENDKIVARRSFQQGIQVCDSGEWKKGEFHTIWGNFYGLGSSGGKNDLKIIEYLKKKYPNSCQRNNGGGALCIEMETRWEIYPAFDQMYVCFSQNLLSDNPNRLDEPFNMYKWNHTYMDMHNHLKAPGDEIKKRNIEKPYLKK